MKKKNKIKIKVNGKYMFIKQKTSVHDLIKALKFPISKIAVEMNKEILDKKNLKKKMLKNKDSIEIVHFIGGG
tara:strand:- start:540 stop:758 length:219 start_codon:yes stop_codon:yes gene_type:complete